MDALLQALKNCGDVFSECFVIADQEKEDRPLVYINQNFVQLSGYGPSEILNRNCRFLQGERTDKDVVNLIRASVKNGECCYYDIVNYKKSGQPFWNRLVLFPIGWSSDDPKYYVGVQADITEKKEKQSATSLASFLESGRSSQEIAHKVKNPFQEIIQSYRSSQYLFYESDEAVRLQKINEFGQLINTNMTKVCTYIRSLD